MGFAEMHDIASQVEAIPALANTTLTAGGAGDNTLASGYTIDLTPTGRTKGRVHSLAFLIFAQATLAQAKHLSITTNVQYQTPDNAWHDVTNPTGLNAVANANILTGGAGGSTEKGVLKIGVNLTKGQLGIGDTTGVVSIPTGVQAVRLQVTPDLDAANTDTAVVNAVAILGGHNTLPQ